jgi:hypothetical protein
VNRLLRNHWFGSLGLFGGGRGKFNVGLLRGRRRKVASAQNLLNLASVVSGILLSNGSKVVGLLLSSSSNLSGLGVDGVGGGLELLVDKLLVGGVDQGSEESNGGSDDGKNPVWYNLDEEAGNKGNDASLE